MSPKPGREVADDLGINEAMLYKWRRCFTKDGCKTLFATLEEENKALRLGHAELKMERDMLKKAVASFAKLQK